MSLPTSMSFVLADLAGQAGDVDLHHRLVPPLIIEIRENAQRHDRGADEHAKQQASPALVATRGG